MSSRVLYIALNHSSINECVAELCNENALVHVSRSHCTETFKGFKKHFINNNNDRLI